MEHARKLIVEDIKQIKYLIEEDEKTKRKNYYIEGKFIQSEIVNGNGRLYPRSVVEREVERYIKECIERNCAYGELGHPTTPTVNLDRVSHMIKEFKMDGNDVWGKAKLLDTPMGNIAKNLIDEGATLGVSSRGLGSLKPHKNGYQIVQDDFKLAVGADIVASPSAPEAFVQGVFEGAEWIFNPVSGTWMEQRVESMQKQVQSRVLTEEEKLNLFKTYIDGLARKQQQNNK